MSTEPPKKLGKYELQERLGRGGMAEVWKAFDTQLQRHVAIKLLHANLQADTNFVARFQREAQVIASLHHPNIVQIHDFQFEQPASGGEPVFYMVMAYIEGQTLADYLASTSAQGKIPSPLEIVNLFTSISLAIDYAHQRGMIHRDIKPANILLDRHNRARNPMGEPILTDFGLAKLLGVSATTLTGGQLGTPLYTSPEQARGYPGNERSDLYSLGVILYEMVTGVVPFRADTPTAVLAQHLFSTPTAPALLNPHIPPALTMVIMTALAKDPNARFSRALTMATAIAEALNITPPESLSQSVSSPDIRDMPTSLAPTSFQPETGSGTPSSPVSAPSSLPPVPVGVSNPGLNPGGATGGAPVTPTIWTAHPSSAPGSPPSQPGASQPGISHPMMAVPTARQEHTPGPGPLSQPGQGNMAAVASPPTAPPVAPPSPPARKKGRRGLLIGLVALLLFVLLGGGLGAYLLLFRPASPSAVSAGGQVFFVSSGQFDPNSAQGIADELDFNLQGLPQPQAGYAYYAWLLADVHPHPEADPMEPPPHFTLPLKIGPLPFSGGKIHYLYPGTATHDNLFSQASRLLITEERTGGPQLGPKASHSAWRYYAEIPQTPYGTPALSAMDHIRHLFYKETKVAVLGLPGGLDVWLFRNTEKIMEWSLSARDDYSPTLTDSSVIHSLFGDILSYLDGSPNVALDVPGGVASPDPVASRVALLSISPAQQQLTDVENNPPGYVDHFALHLNGVVQAPDATPQMRALGIQMIQALNNAKAWLQQVRTDAKKLIAMDTAQLSQPSTLILLDTMLQYATYAYVGQLDPKTNKVIPGVLQVHYDVQKLAVLNLTTNLPTSL